MEHASPSTLPLRTLIVEDREDDALLLINQLKRGGYSIHPNRVDNPEHLRQALQESWDIIFCDYSMPTMNGIEALKLVRKENEDVPFIFVSGTIGEDVAVEAMRNGAQDYIMKDNLKRLLPAVQRELHDYQTRKERRDAEQRLHHLAHYDNLTGLPNRFHFIEQLQQTIDQYHPGDGLIAAIYIDIDRFKSINDSLGYEAGNMLLKDIAQRLQQSTREAVVARLATDEFALMLSVSSRQVIEEILGNIFSSLDQPYTIYGLSLYFSASIGVSLFPNDADNAQGLLGNADIATYRVKDEGGRDFLFYTPSMAVQLEERLKLERNMRIGLQNNEFHLQYQPQVDLTTGNIIGMEALLRWNNAELGSVSPAHFIPMAENTGFILPLGDWVLRQACQQLGHWQNTLQQPIRVAINVAARQFHNVDLVEDLKRLLAAHQLDPQLLELEITETAIIRDVDKAIETLQKIQQLGIKVALDDFGTGYSSMSYLKTFKTDYLKIDQSFIRGIPNDLEDQAIVSAIIAMAEKLSIKTIAEGVENRAQYDFLKSEGCDMIQGYYISRPVNSREVPSLLNSFKEKKN